MVGPLSEQGVGLILGTDGIAKRAAEHSLPDSSMGCEWQNWKLAFDQIEISPLLDTVTLQSMRERSRAPVCE